MTGGWIVLSVCDCVITGAGRAKDKVSCLCSLENPHFTSSIPQTASVTIT